MKRLVRGLYSDGTAAFVKKRTIQGGTHYQVSFRSVEKDAIQKAWICLSPDGERRHIPMKKQSGESCEIWKAGIPCKWKKFGYRFDILTSSGLVYMDQLGVHRTPPFDMWQFQILNRSTPLSWLKGRTFYQIFPDRFCRSQKDRFSSAPLEGAYGRTAQLRDWGSRLRTFKECGSMDFYGGDLPGIEEKLDYLQDLGIGGIYLNPVFHSPSNHRYDTQDYRLIDPRLGTNEDFASLVKASHERGIKVILDAVFNHVGTSHRWFNREGFYKEDGAWQDRNSPYAEFFTFYEHPHQYDCWLGVDTLPLFDFRSEKLRDVLYRNEDSIAQKWMKEPYNIDGYRFDVANMLARNGHIQLHKEVWAEMSECLKDVNPEVYLMGEHFWDCPEHVDGTGLDGVMNYYGFMHPVLRWLSGEEPLPPKGHKESIEVDYDGTELADDLHKAAARLAHDTLLAQYNLLGSHDTRRALTVFHEDEKLLRVAVQLLFTWPGTPNVYYGDEIGFSGETDPFCRECMEWDESKWNGSLRDYHKQFICLQRSEKALNSGGYRILSAQGDVFAFARIHGDEVIVSAVNRGRKTQSCDIDLFFSGVKRGELTPLAGLASSTVKISNSCATISIPPKGGVLYKLK